MAMGAGSVHDDCGADATPASSRRLIESVVVQLGDLCLLHGQTPLIVGSLLVDSIQEARHLIFHVLDACAL